MIGFWFTDQGSAAFVGGIVEKMPADLDNTPRDESAELMADVFFEPEKGKRS